MSHCGQYSVERMLALEEYVQRVSFLRVAAVCMLTPLAPLSLVIAAASLPLRHVADGFDVNYMFWIRHFFVVAFAVLSNLMQAKAWLSELPFTIWRVLIITIWSAGFAIAFDVLIAKVWIFPVPFMNLLQSPLIILIPAMITILVLGRQALRDVPDSNYRMRRYFMLIAVQGSLITIYPAYHAFFLLVSTSVQPFLMVLLAVANIGIKNVLAACGGHLEDRLPEVIVFTVDVFSALYSALCMRSNNSFKTVAIVVTLNVFDLILALHGMNRRSQVALANRDKSYRRQKLSTKALGVDVPVKPFKQSLGTLFQTTLQLLKMPGQLDPAELRQICLLSCVEHKLSEANLALLAALAARCVYHNERHATGRHSMAERKSRYSSAAMSGPELGVEHFGVALNNTSYFTQRLRAAVRKLKQIPEAGKRFSVLIGTRLSYSLGIQSDSRNRSSPPTALDVDEESVTDSFDSDTRPSDVAGPLTTSSRRQSQQSGPGTPLSSSLKTASHLGDTLSQGDLFSRQGEKGGRSSILLRTESSQHLNLQNGTGSRIQSAQLGLVTGSQRGSRNLIYHLGSSRRLAEFANLSTNVETSLKLRPLLLSGNPVINDILRGTRKQNTVAVNQTLQLLFNNEYLGLIAYAQCITPTIFIVYMTIMIEMPNRTFYLDKHDVEDPNRLAQRYAVVTVFVALQMAILIALHTFVAVRFGVSTLYQVAFVLETHARLVQGKITTWLLFAVSFTLEHYGVDFSFRFDWIFGNN